MVGGNLSWCCCSAVTYFLSAVFGVVVLLLIVSRMLEILVQFVFNYWFKLLTGAMWLF